MTFLRELLSTFGAVTVLTTAAESAAVQGKPAPPVMIEVVQVNIVNVEIYVTGPDGRPLTGLGPPDFEILEDGKPVAISNFYAAVEGRPVPAAPAGQEAAAEPPRPADEQALALVIFVDNANLTIVRRNAVFAQLRSLLREALKAGGARVMFATSGGGVRVRQEFTSDENVLMATVERLEREVGRTGTGTDPNAMLMRMMGGSSFPSGDSGGSRGALTQDFEKQNALSMREQIRSAAEEAFHETRNSLKALTAFLDSLAGLPGRKALVYVSQGISMRPGEAMLKEWEAVYGRRYDPTFNAVSEAGRYTVNTEFNEVVRHANAGRVTFYCVDGSASVGAGPTAEQASLTEDPAIAATDALFLRQSLEAMSGATGGRTVTAGPDLSETLGRTMAELNTYYSLGYASPHSGDGRYHTIKVRLKHEGARLRHREGYLDKTADERTVERHLSALLFETASNPLGVAVSVTPEGRQKGDTYPVKVVITVPLGNLVFLPREGNHEGSVSVWLATRDAEDRLSVPAKQSFPVRIPNDRLQTALGQVGSFTFQAVVRKGSQRMAVTVRDELAQVDSTAVASFTAGEITPGSAGAT